MPSLTQRDADCRIFTFKEGLLSKVAHDLELALERFELSWDDALTAVEARFDTTSLHVLGAVKNGALDRGALSARDVQKIESSLANDVLHVRRFPEARFVASAVQRISDDEHELVGELDLHGRRRELRARARKQLGRWVVELALNQPDFGITPFTAMMGTLRVQPGVRVRISAPAT